MLIVPPDLIPQELLCSTWHGSWHRVVLHLCWTFSKDQARHCIFPLPDDSNSQQKPYFELLCLPPPTPQESWLGSEQGPLMWGVPEPCSEA